MPTLNTGGKFCERLEKGLAFRLVATKSPNQQTNAEIAHKAIKLLVIRSENLNVASYALAHKLLDLAWCHFRLRKVSALTGNSSFYKLANFLANL